MRCIICMYVAHSFNVWMNEEAIYEWKKSEWVQNTQVSWQRAQQIRVRSKIHIEIKFIFIHLRAIVATVGIFFIHDFFYCYLPLRWEYFKVNRWVVKIQLAYNACSMFNLLMRSCRVCHSSELGQKYFIIKHHNVNMVPNYRTNRIDASSGVYIVTHIRKK